MLLNCVLIIGKMHERKHTMELDYTITFCGQDDRTFRLFYGTVQLPVKNECILECMQSVYVCLDRPYD